MDEKKEKEVNMCTVSRTVYVTDMINNLFKFRHECFEETRNMIECHKVYTTHDIVCTFRSHVSNS